MVVELLLGEVEGGRTIMKSGSRLVACTMLHQGVVVGQGAVVVRLWRRIHRGRVMNTSILEVAIPQAAGALLADCRADPGEAVYRVVRGWDAEDGWG